MTTDEHNPTSQPWLPSQPADTAGSGGESDSTPPADTVPGPQSDTDADPPVPGAGDPDASGNENADTSDAEPPAAADPGYSAPESGAPGTPWLADPAAGPWGGDNGFAPPSPGAFTAPAAESFAHGSGQFQQPDPNQYQPTDTGYTSGQFTQPDPDQLQSANSAYGSGQFAQPDPSQAGNSTPGGQFDQPYPNQYQTPGSGQFDQQSGGFQAPGPEAGGPHGSGQFAQPDPNMYPGQYSPEQPPYPGSSAPGPEGAGQAPGGYAPGGSPDPGPAPAPEGEAPGGPIYGWAPPPAPAAPPVQQPPFQQAPPPMGNPQAGQFQTQDWGANPGQPAPQQPPQQQYRQPGQPQPGQFQPRHLTEPGQPGHSVNDLNLLKRARKAPRGGWRRAVHKVSRGVINPGESASDVVHRDLVGRVNAPVHGDFRIAILSLKGGVGKTTTTVGLGATFASLRGDRVIAIDANPDLGTLAHRVPRQTRSTVRNLLEDRNITRYSDVRAHTSQSPSRLEVLASEQDPAVSEAFSEADYRRAIGILQSFYNIILTDCGTGLMHSAMSGVLDMASSLVLVTSPAIDGARSASATLDWLDYHGYSHLVRQTVVVVNASRRGSTSVNLDHLRRLFLDRTRAVQVVPFDDHLAEGAEIDLELVSKPTRQALLELAAMVADDFANVDGYPYDNRY
ncbi:AAA family ATPase [Nocardia sp. NPDC019395]|uniref:MinD/ParA family ATP-binding protein n=1 Tax=Nocardia sp. NPDC019395 TaxID=3154686 RepID=UPI0033F464BC